MNMLDCLENHEEYQSQWMLDELARQDPPREESDNTSHWKERDLILEQPRSHGSQQGEVRAGIRRERRLE
jgi:hypothetical protein